MPYAVRAAAEYTPPDNYSYSTNATIACVVGHMLGFTCEPMFTVTGVKPMESLYLRESQRETFTATWLAVVEKLVKELPA